MKKIILILCLFIASCTPIQRLHHLQKKHPELFIEKIKIDTIIKPEIKYDTTFLYQNFIKLLHDTITINKDRVVTKLWTKHDTVQIRTTLKKDTIINKTIEKFIEKPAKKDNWGMYYISTIITIFFICLVIIVKKFKK